MPERRVCVVTGSRADYGLLTPLLKHIASDSEMKLQLVATGMHLSPEFGLTYQAIEKDGFVVDAKVEMVLSSDTAVGIGKSIGMGVIGLADVFERLRPDVVVLLGDRYEILAAAQAAFVARIPIAHIHGGEITEGAIDDSIRHAITKFSYLHFVASEPFRTRVIQLGEDPRRVFNVGAPGLDQIDGLPRLSRSDLEDRVGMRLRGVNFLVTYHPATLGVLAPEVAVRELLLALDEFPDAAIIFTDPNADSGGRIVASAIDTYVRANSGRACRVASLGHQAYLSAISHVDVVVGNSSSGLIEAPHLGKPTVNIGDRQRGRPRAKSVIDCREDTAAIAAALGSALEPRFRDRLRNIASPYGRGGASAMIKETLKKEALDGLPIKRFHDLRDA